MIRRIARPYCHYCRRDLSPPHPPLGTSLTLDHIRSAARGGSRRVLCCRACNGLKGNLLPSEWFWFIQHHTRWWKLFQTPAQVVDVIRQERVRRAYAGEVQLGRESYA